MAKRTYQKTAVEGQRRSVNSQFDYIDHFDWENQSARASMSEIRAREAVKQELKMFAFTEALAHSDEGAYGALARNDGDVITINGIAYRTSAIRTRYTGLIGEILVPLVPSPEHAVCINWMGTYSAGTALADFESTPGADSYRKDEALILAQINAAVGDYRAKTEHKVDLMFTGHSLGGALAQMTIQSVTRSIATNLNDTHKEDDEITETFLRSEIQYREASKGKGVGRIPRASRTHLNAESVGSITLGVWNSAGVSHAVENNTNQLAGIVSNAGVQINAMFGMVAGDGVQRTGQGSVFSNTSDKEARVSILKVKGFEGYGKKCLFFGASALAGAGLLISGAAIPIGIGALLGGVVIGLTPIVKATLDGHISNHFVGDKKNKVEATLFRNNTPMGQKAVCDKLTNKSPLWNMTMGKVGFKGLHFALRGFISRKNKRKALEAASSEITQTVRI